MRWLDGITNSKDLSLSKLEDSEEQGSLVCCSLWGCKELDSAERLNSNRCPREDNTGDFLPV